METQYARWMMLAITLMIPISIDAADNPADRLKATTPVHNVKLLIITHTTAGSGTHNAAKVELARGVVTELNQRAMTLDFSKVGGKCGICISSETTR